METQNSYDVAIIGGSYAGLSAAMALGRAIRRALIVDSGSPCNRQTPHAHNFLTQDGQVPADIAALCKKQVLAYPTLQYTKDRVEMVKGENSSFYLETTSGRRMQAKKILFATGIRDQMPAIDGFADCWGITAIHCPYCHGYEYRNEPTGVIVNGDMALEKGRLIHNWTKKLTLFTNGTSTISTIHREQFASMGVEIIEQPVKKVEHKEGYINRVILVDGSSITLKVLYAHLPFEQHCKIPERLGCTINEVGHIAVDGFQKTNVPGIYAAGDNASPLRSLAMAVSTGAVAGAFINHELITEGY
ncbi:NAD(P)/FAD-dependent oxidoreductase [Olivibacter sp. SDN3]|uniref:NAD(P)/FAD-dependent oxidoreductase n=1 Tax=Olivibacter sp. SDN3 TaxID=2764720 RepID=UPI001650F3DB|nr:NAD(P)/FAD-dependent oxidoreductase [Olivibacter sp. SDN3]QNL48261.1 NAD(P)/FAD-dependent oxidoreductase [Olivibacter sp. SDN3]